MTSKVNFPRAPPLIFYTLFQSLRGSLIFQVHLTSSSFVLSHHFTSPVCQQYYPHNNSPPIFNFHFHTLPSPKCSSNSCFSCSFPFLHHRRLYFSLPTVINTTIIMAPTTVSSTDQVAIPVLSDKAGARCLQILHHIHDLSDLRRNPPRDTKDPDQFAHLQSLVRVFAAFKAEILAEFEEPPVEPLKYSKPIEPTQFIRTTEDYLNVTETMSTRPSIPGLTTNGLPAQSEDAAAATNSPARGKAMKEALLQKLRPPPLEHTWEFWHDRQGRESKPAWAQEEEAAATNPASPADKLSESNEYESRLVKLHVIRDLRQFWETMNHFDLSTLRLRDSVHLFHLGVKPVWEDPRNVKGGAWTFRVPKEKAAQFWKEVALMAIGGELQSAVDNSAKRHTFIDDICGISYSVRFNSHLISIWNRDAENQEGIDRLRAAVLGGISPELTLRDNQFYYKRHSEHAGFRFPEASKEGQ